MTGWCVEHVGMLCVEQCGSCRKGERVSGQEWVTTAVLLICAGTDLCNRKVYRWIVMLYLGLAMAGYLATGMPGGMSWFVADLLPGAFCLLLAWTTHQGIGYGDAMLILACGLSVGWKACIGMGLTAFFLAGVAASVRLIRHRGKKKELPFVPFLLVAWVWQLLCGV